MIIKRSPAGPTESAELSFTPAKRTAKAQRIPFACIEETPCFDSSPTAWVRLTPVAWQSTGHGRSSGLTPGAGSVGLRHIVVTMQLRAFHGILGWEPGVALLTQLHPRLPSAVLRTQDFARLRRVCFSTNPHWAKSLGHMCK